MAKREFKTYKLAETEIKEKVNTIINETSQLAAANQDIKSFGIDYKSMSEDLQYKLGAYVNLMFSAAQNLIRPIKALIPKFTDSDIEAFSRFNNQLFTLKENQSKVVISLANFFHLVELSEKDVNILYKSLKKNDRFLESSGLSRDEFEKKFIILASAIDGYKYPRVIIK